MLAAGSILDAHVLPDPAEPLVSGFQGAGSRHAARDLSKSPATLRDRLPWRLKWLQYQPAFLGGFLADMGLDPFQSTI